MTYFYFIAILIAFLGGLLGRAWAFSNVHHRILAFLVPVSVCAVLMHIPLLADQLQSGVRVDWQELKALRAYQGLILLASFLATGTGWLCSFCIQKMFED